MKAYLFHLDHNNCAFELNDYFAVGSGENCRWQHDSMDERHARIEKQGDGYILKDLRSTSGTFINSQRIKEAPLQDGDWIQIGNQTLMFSFSANSSGTIRCVRTYHDGLAKYKIGSPVRS